MNFIRQIFVVIALAFVFATPALAVELKADIQAQIDAGAAPGFGSQKIDPQAVAVSIIKDFLGLLGTIFIVLIVLSGYWYITAQGDDAKIEKAMKTAQGAVIGLILVLMAYGITYLVGTKALGILKR